jgi:hypothetical protein
VIGAEFYSSVATRAVFVEMRGKSGNRALRKPEQGVEKCYEIRY